MGDFNLHISEGQGEHNDISAAIFTDTCKAMELYQHVTFPTHKAGNTLDLILSEVANSIRVGTVRPKAPSSLTTELLSAHLWLRMYDQKNLLCTSGTQKTSLLSNGSVKQTVTMWNLVISWGHGSITGQGISPCHGYTGTSQKMHHVS